MRNMNDFRFHSLIFFFSYCSGSNLKTGTRRRRCYGSSPENNGSPKLSIIDRCLEKFPLFCHIIWYTYTPTEILLNKSLFMIY